MVNAERLALVKPTAILVNAARGPLIHPLRKNRIGGVGLEVFETEPLPSASASRNAAARSLRAHFYGSFGAEDKCGHPAMR